MAESRSIPIDTASEQYFLFGECKSSAILSLDGGEIVYFDLALDRMCDVITIQGSTSPIEQLRVKILDQALWEQYAAAITHHSTPTSRCEIRAFEADSVTTLLMTGADDSGASIFFNGKISIVPHFVTNRLNEARYLSVLMNELETSVLEDHQVFVAGDHGFIIKTGQERHFLEYPSRRRIGVCQLEEIRKRAGGLPADAIFQRTNPINQDDIEVLVSLANYFRRSPLTAISFGCES